MNLQTDTVTYYAYYASALINGDYSGLEDYEIEMVERFEQQIKEDYGPSALIAGVADNATPYFAKPNRYMHLSGDAIDYVIHYYEDESA